MYNSYAFNRRDMPDGNMLLFSFIVYGHIGRLVNFSWLQNQNLQNNKTHKNIRIYYVILYDTLRKYLH